MDRIVEPFLLSLIAGSSTAVGGIIVLVLRRISDRVVSFSLAFASGVMLLVAFNNLFLEAATLLTHFELMSMFSLGAIIMIALDLALPHIEPTTKSKNGENPEMLSEVGMQRQIRRRLHGGKIENPEMFRKGMLIAMGISLHNFPEGLVVAAGCSYLPRLGLIIATAIMFHNIPEGLATAIPLRKAGVKSWKVLALTLLSGMTESVGALIAAFALSFVGTESFIGSSLAFAAGVMTYITADELIPIAHEYGYKHTVSIGLLLGIMFSLLMDALLS